MTGDRVHEVDDGAVALALLAAEQLDHADARTPVQDGEGVHALQAPGGEGVGGATGIAGDVADPERAALFNDQAGQLFAPAVRAAAVGAAVVPRASPRNRVRGG